MKNVLITGANGQLGNELAKIMPSAVLAGHNVLDITDKASVDKFIKSRKIDTVINCAAYTAVDLAEDNYDDAYKINAIGPRNLAQTGCKIIHISTDYVFSGNAKVPYKTTDKTNPLSVYGSTKLAGENAVLENSENGIIIRTSWLYSPFGKNFVKTMRNLGATRSEISVVADQYGLPTYAANLAFAIFQIIPQIKPDNSGVYHYSNAGEGITWYDFADEIMKQSGLTCAVKPITTDQYPTRAVRPKYSVMDTSKIQKTFGVKIPMWQDALKHCIKELEKQH